MRTIVSYIEILCLPILVFAGLYAIQYSYSLGVADKYSLYVGLGLISIVVGLVIGFSGMLLLNKKRSIIKSHLPILAILMLFLSLALLFKLLLVL